MRRRHSSGTGPRRLGLWRLASMPAWAVLVAVLVVPTSAFLLLAFFPAFFGQGGRNFSVSAFANGYQGFVAHALVNSVWVSALVGLLGLGIALALAWRLERRPTRAARAWRLAIWALLLLPTYLSALGFQYLLAPSGVLDHATGWNPVPLASALLGPVGVVGVLTLRAIPFAYFSIASVVGSLGRNLEDAARVHALSRWQRHRVQVGSLMPALLAGFLLVFAESISDFGVASTLAASAHFPIVTYAVFLYASALPVDLPGASAVSWSLIGIFAAVLAVQRGLLGRRSYELRGADRSAPEQASRHATPPHAARGGVGRLLPTAAMGALFVVGLGGPLSGIAFSSLLGGSATSGSAAVVAHPGLTLSAYRQVLHSPQLLGTIGLSLWLGLAGATLAVLVGLAVNLWGQLRAGPRAAGLLDLGLVAIIGLPSIVLGAGFIFFYDLPGVYRAVPVYGTDWLLLVGYVVGFSPVATRLLRGSLAQAGRRPFDAGRVHGLVALRSWCVTTLPLVARPVATTWLFLVAMIMFELPLSEILHPAGGVPVAVAVAVTLKSQVAAGTALTVLAIGTLFVVIALTGALGIGARRLAAARRRRRAVPLDGARGGTPDPAARGDADRSVQDSGAVARGATVGAD